MRQVGRRKRGGSWGKKKGGENPVMLTNDVRWCTSKKEGFGERKGVMKWETLWR